MQIVLLVVWGLPSTQRTLLSIPAAVFSLIASILICILSDLEHRKSLRPSTLLNIYLFFSLLFDIVQTRTLWLIDGFDRVATTFSVSLTLKLALLIVEAIEKSAFFTGPYRSIPKEASSSVYNRSVFWWLNRLFLLGFREVLNPEDLDDLDSGLRSAALAAKARDEWANGMIALV